MQPKWIKMDSSFLLFFFPSSPFFHFLWDSCLLFCATEVAAAAAASDLMWSFQVMQNRFRCKTGLTGWDDLERDINSSGGLLLQVEKKALVIFRFSDGVQNKSGKVAVSVDSFAINQLKQKSTITLLSENNYIILNYYIKYLVLEPCDQHGGQVCCDLPPPLFLESYWSSWHSESS